MATRERAVGRAAAALSRLYLSNVSRRPLSTVCPPNRKSYPKFGLKPKVVSALEAVSTVPSGSSIYVQGHAATPTELLNGLCEVVDQTDNKYNLSHIILSGETKWTNPKYYGKIRSNCLFICGGLRKAVREGAADYTPVFLSDVPRLFIDERIPLDYAFISVSPPDEHGYCTLGVDVDCSSAAVNMAKHVIAVVNPTMPRTFGDSTIHSSQIDYLVHTERPIYHKSTPDQIGENEMKIGKLIAENLVDNGATLQLGIGGIPDSTLAAMSNHKDLGIHTELVCDGILDLIESNVVNCSKKTLLQGKIVTSFAYGSPRFFKFVDNNPLFHFASCSWTNANDIIRQNNKMTAINSCLEIDLTGQIVSDSIGEGFYSGFGGQVDFVSAASNCFDGEGKAIIALTARTNKGRSKIVPTLAKGAGVVTTRGHVHYVVTEFGIADLFGKHVRQRAYELINIAHPDDRAELEKASFERLKVMPSRD